MRPRFLKKHGVKDLIWLLQIKTMKLSMAGFFFGTVTENQTHTIVFPLCLSEVSQVSNSFCTSDVLPQAWHWINSMSDETAVSGLISATQTINADLTASKSWATHQSQHYYWQVKWITVIITLQWHVLLGNHSQCWWWWSYFDIYLPPEHHSSQSTPPWTWHFLISTTEDPLVSKCHVSS